MTEIPIEALRAAFDAAWPGLEDDPVWGTDEDEDDDG